MLSAMASDYVNHLRLFSREVRIFILASALFGAGWTFVLVLLNLRLEALGFSKSLIGDIQGANSLGMMLIAVPAAMLYDRFDPKKLLLGSVVVSSSALLGLAFSANPITLAGFSALSGAALGVHFVISGPYIMEHSSETERLHVFGVLSAVGVGAGIFGSYVAGWLPSVLSRTIESSMRLGIGLAMGATVVAFAIFPLLLLNSSKPKSTCKVLRDYVIPAEIRHYSRLLSPDIMTAFGAGITIPFLNLFLAERFRLDSNGIGSVMSATSAFIVAGMLLGPPLARRFDPIKTVTVLQVLSVPFMIVLALTYSFNVALIMILFRAALMNMGHPMAKAFQLEQVLPQHRSSVNALAMLGWNGTTMLGSVLGGRIIQSSGYTASIILTAAIYLVSSALYLSFWYGPFRLKTSRISAG